MDVQNVVVIEEEFCTGKCAHSKKFHVVSVDNGKAFACARMDCGCMEYVPKPPPVPVAQ